MLAAVDVDYRQSGAVAACVLFEPWNSPKPADEWTTSIAQVAAYEPGAFYKRELPCLLAVLARTSQPLDAVVVDAYVDLAPGKPGLGRHLFEALHVPVIGVAKTYFASATHAVEIVRGESKTPLYVTAAGMSPAEAAGYIQSMAGPYRIPDLLKRVDRLCREAPE